MTYGPRAARTAFRRRAAGSLVAATLTLGLAALCVSCGERVTPLGSLRGLAHDTKVVIAGSVVPNRPRDYAVLVLPPTDSGVRHAFYQDSDPYRHAAEVPAGERGSVWSCYAVRDKTGRVSVATRGAVPRVGSSARVHGTVLGDGEPVLEDRRQPQ